MKKHSTFIIMLLVLCHFTTSAQTAHNVTLSSNQPPQLFADAGPDTSFGTPGTYILGGMPTVYGGTPPYSFLWSPPTDLNSDTLINPVFTHNGSYPSIQYVLTVTDDRSCKATDSVTISLLYISIEESDGASMKVYPIPATSFLAVDLETPEGELALFTTEGRLIVKQAVNSVKNRLALENLSRGVYLLTYTRDDIRQTIRIVIE